ncbi:MAG: DUF4286 family protein [Chlorobi bacterium]|nr:DUF4286 family protein [Chlorobiota bacterium]
MIIYQVLCTVPVAFEDEWITWMMDEHIRDVVNTEMFTHVDVARVMEPACEGAVQYCVQYYCPSLELYEQYRKDFAPVLQAAHNARYGGVVTIERMVMETKSWNQVEQSKPNA